MKKWQKPQPLHQSPHLNDKTETTTTTTSNTQEARKKTLLSEIEELEDDQGLTREHIKLPYEKEIDNKINKASKIMREAKRKKRETRKSSNYPP